jgi:hypothetical protein
VTPQFAASLSDDARVVIYDRNRGAQKLTGENLEVVWAEFSTLSQPVLLITPNLCSLQMATSKVENSAQASSC